MPNDSGLRRVIANGKAGAELWPHDQRRVKDVGLVHYDTDADVTVQDTIPDTKQRWDGNYPGPGIVGRPEDGPAVKELQRRRGENG